MHILYIIKEHKTINYSNLQAKDTDQSPLSAKPPQRSYHPLPPTRGLTLCVVYLLFPSAAQSPPTFLGVPPLFTETCLGGIIEGKCITEGVLLPAEFYCSHRHTHTCTGVGKSRLKYQPSLPKTDNL